MKKEKLKFIFPNIMAKMMKNIDMRTQLESSMISMFMIMIGMTLTSIYTTFFLEIAIIYKCLIVFNLFCAFIFISSFLVTTYQQYISYMTIAGIDPDKHKEEILKRGNIFKRIKLAIRKKKKAKNKRLEIIDEAVENMIKIKQEELKDMKELDKKAQELAKEESRNNTASQENNSNKRG